MRTKNISQLIQAALMDYGVSKNNRLWYWAAKARFYREMMNSFPDSVKFRVKYDEAHRYFEMVIEES